MKGNFVVCVSRHVQIKTLEPPTLREQLLKGNSEYLQSVDKKSCPGDPAVAPYNYEQTSQCKDSQKTKIRKMLQELGEI